MISVPLTEDALRVAFSRLEDFKTVNTGSEGIDEAFATLSGSLGIDKDMAGLLLELISQLFGTDENLEFVTGATFGLMVGLIAADHAAETS